MNRKRLLTMLLIILLVVSMIGITIYFFSEFNNNEYILQGDIEKVSTYNNPIIPEGFKKVETDSASWELENGIPKGWNDGLVIEDEIGNQFVWVPVQEITYDVLVKQNNYNIQEEEQKEEQLKKYNQQIQKHGGFYIARYEAGVSEEMQKNISNISAKTNDIQGIPVSKKEQIVWNYISLKNAKKNAQSMYNNENIASDLMSPIQWLTIMQWIYNSGFNIVEAKEWGNFSNVNFDFNGYYSTDYGKTYKYGKSIFKSKYNMILSTGATERNKSNNIYDLGGNVREFTDGWVRDRGYYSAGGHYDNIGSHIYTLSLIGVEPLEKLGYRIVLYIK